MSDPIEEWVRGNGITITGAVAAVVTSSLYWLKKMDFRIVKGGGDLPEHVAAGREDIAELREMMEQRFNDLEVDVKNLSERSIALDTHIEHMRETLDKHDRILTP